MIKAAEQSTRQLVDQYDRPLVPAPTPPTPAEVRATYDAARTSPDFVNYWANADTYDADSANDPNVRHTLISRSRYEVNNNGYADGIAQTYSTDVIGTGPVLNMTTASEAFNRMVEFEFAAWWQAIGMRRKLWTMAMAKHTDGEAFGLLVINPAVNHEVPVDVSLLEAEQIQSPMINDMIEGHTDGVWFDRFGNITAYDLMESHPGSAAGSLDFETEQIPAQFMAHWYKVRRPGQHRGTPEMTSTLNAGAGSRRWREATLASAESAASLAIILKTGFMPEKLAELPPMSEVPINHRMMTAVPAGWDATQMKSEHPNSTYDSFMRSHVSEMARPKGMPYNKAAADSSSYNFASGRLDHISYYASLDVDRADCDEMTLDVIFNIWFRVAAGRLNWLDRDPAAIARVINRHRWAWPAHQVADIKSEAEVRDKNLKNGTLTHTQYWAAKGMEDEKVIEQLAAENGVDVERMREIRLAATFNSQQQLSSAAAQAGAVGETNNGD